MNFYEWFFLEKGREPAGLFSWSHLLSCTVALALFIGLGFFLGLKFRDNKKGQRVTLIVAAITVVVVELAKIGYCLVGSTNIADTLIGNAPLYFCDIMIFVIPVAAFTRGRVQDCCLDFIAICGFLMGFMGNYFAGNIYLSHAAISFFALNSLINHSISAFAAMFVFAAKLNKMEKRNIPFVIGILFAFMTIALVMAYSFGKTSCSSFMATGRLLRCSMTWSKATKSPTKPSFMCCNVGISGSSTRSITPSSKPLRSTKRQSRSQRNKSASNTVFQINRAV